MTRHHDASHTLLADYLAWLTSQENPNRTLANARAFVDHMPTMKRASISRRDHMARELHRDSGRMTEGVTPAPADIRALRERLGLTQDEAGAMVHVNTRTWQKWEHGERSMHAAFYELFRIKAGV